jgi:hypothetical protein
MKVIDGIRLLFPQGTLDWRFNLTTNEEEKSPYSASQPPGDDAWDEPPADPIDLFALVGFLLSRSGAYHHVQPETQPRLPGSARRIEVGDNDRRSWRGVGRTWIATTHIVNLGGTDFVQLAIPELVRSYWAKLRDSFGAVLFDPLQRGDPAPAWWQPAVALLAIADETALNVGFLTNKELSGDNALFLHLMSEYRIGTALTKSLGEMGLYTLSSASPDVVCVLPKSRTPALGCTMRSLSHNLALLPPRGLARAHWLGSATIAGERDATSPLNLLLVPYPYAVPASAFDTAGDSTADSSIEWGWFTVGPDQGARTDETHFLDFVTDLLAAARADVGKIHGIVFPELALSHRLYRKLVDTLKAEPDIVLIAAGLNTDADGNHTNCAVIRITATDAPSLVVEDIRPKHHRWRLESSQIASYALGARLDPNRLWWEQLDVLDRNLSVGVIRGETSIATLICEDLARVDPAQEVLRAIGPNIVLALLMDGAQLLTRWPNRYATVLAEDPGSSVLTLTSLGLIKRVNETGFHQPSRCIALWRDDKCVRELNLPAWAQALCLTLSPSRIEEATLDGRSDDWNSIAWRLSGVQPVRSSLEEPRWIS